MKNGEAPAESNPGVLALPAALESRFSYFELNLIFDHAAIYHP
jgi:hypothetical protein